MKREDILDNLDRQLTYLQKEHDANKLAVDKAKEIFKQIPVDIINEFYNEVWYNLDECDGLLIGSLLGAWHSRWFNFEIAEDKLSFWGSFGLDYSLERDIERYELEYNEETFQLFNSYVRKFIDDEALEAKIKQKELLAMARSDYKGLEYSLKQLQLKASEFFKCMKDSVSNIIK